MTIGPFWRGWWCCVAVSNASTLYFRWVMGVIS